MAPDTSNVAPVLYHVTDLAMDRGEGAYVWSTDGTRYMDFTCGIGVTNLASARP